MKITRALLLSSKKQAEAWEQEVASTFPWTQYRQTYRYLVTEGEGWQLQIFRVTPRKHEGRVYNVLASEPHVEESFGDVSALTDFLRDNQIDPEDGWSPIEESADADHP